jgi:Uma2 family endonuclease
VPDDTNCPATVEDLIATEGKAELVGGRIIRFPFLTVQAGRMVRKIARSLENHVAESGVGEVWIGSLCFVLHEPLPSGRQSFCPDLSYLSEPPLRGPLGFVLGAPAFAVEFVREGGEPFRAMVERVDDYFRAGSSTVWVIDSRDLRVLRYRPGQRGPAECFWDQTADAEPAVSGWCLKVEELLPYPPN